MWYYGPTGLQCTVIGHTYWHNITSVALLETAIRNSWANIPHDFIQDLYQTIPRRLTVVIRANACITKY